MIAVTTARRLTECSGEFIERNDRRISASAFETAEILLTEPRANFDLLLGQAFLSTQAREVASDQLAHIHAQLVAVYTL